MRSLALRDRHAFRTLVLLSLYKPWYIIDGGTMALGKVRGLKRGEVGHSPTPSLVEIHRVGETPIRTREHYYPPLDRESWLSGLHDHILAALS